MQSQAKFNRFSTGVDHFYSLYFHSYARMDRRSQNLAFRVLKTPLVARDKQPVCQASPGMELGAGPTSCDASRNSRSSAFSNTVAAGCSGKERLGTAGFVSVRTGEVPGSPPQCQNEACLHPLCVRCSSPSTGEFAEERESIPSEMRPLDGGTQEQRTKTDEPSPRLAHPHQAEHEGGVDQTPVVSRTKPTGGVGCSEQEQMLSAGGALGPFREPGGTSASLGTHEEAVVAAAADRADGRGKLVAEWSTNDYHPSEGIITKEAAITSNKSTAGDENAGSRADTCSIPRPTSADAALVPAKTRRRGAAASLSSKAPIPFQFATPELMSTVLAVRGTVGARRQQQQQQQRSQVLPESRPNHQQTQPLSLVRQPPFQQRRNASEDQDDRSECTVS